MLNSYFNVARDKMRKKKSSNNNNKINEQETGL